MLFWWKFPSNLFYLRFVYESMLVARVSTLFLDSGQSRGYGFVSFADVQSAIDARNHAHGREIFGHPIRIDFSHTEGPHTPTPGMYMGKPTR